MGASCAAGSSYVDQLWVRREGPRVPVGCRMGRRSRMPASARLPAPRQRCTGWPHVAGRPRLHPEHWSHLATPAEHGSVRVGALFSAAVFLRPGRTTNAPTSAANVRSRQHLPNDAERSHEGGAHGEKVVHMRTNFFVGNPSLPPTKGVFGVRPWQLELEMRPMLRLAPGDRIQRPSEFRPW